MMSMTKNIFSLFIFLISTSAFSSTITEVFTIENGNNLQSQMTKANSKRLKLINDLVYLAIINDHLIYHVSCTIYHVYFIMY